MPINGNPVSGRLRLAKVMSASALALAAMAAWPVFAKQQADPGKPGDASAISTIPNPQSVSPKNTATAAASADIVVTGSRVATGFNTPTPVTVVTAARIAELGQVSAQQALNDLPSVRGIGTTTNAGQGQPLSGGGGGVYTSSVQTADLRGLNASRTLTLIDGRRVVPALGNGAVDLNIIPPDIISRIEVVTSGASAAYGSDAVAGVVNVILDKDLRGIKGQLDYGISEKGDGRSTHAALAAGTKIGDRFSVVGAVDYRDEPSIGNCFTRNWCKPGFAFTTSIAGVPTNYVAKDGIAFDTFSYGGVLVQQKPGGQVTPLGQFVGNGVFSDYTRGSPNGGGYMVGGGPNNVSYYDNTDIRAQQRVVSTFVHSEYEVSDTLKIMAEGSYANNQSTILAVPGLFRFGFAPPSGQTGGIPIYQDNAYLLESNPALAAQIAAFPDTPGTGYDASKGLNYALLGKAMTDSLSGTDLDQRFKQYSNTDTYRGTIGASGKIFGRFSWDAYYQFGETVRKQTLSNVVNLSNLGFASDAVFGPDGTIVCRSAAATANGCVPIDLLGTPQQSQAAVNYIFGTEHDEQKYQQQVGAVNLRGDLFSTWAGPVSIAAGYEHRYEHVSYAFERGPGVLFQAGGVPLEGSTSINEFYGEIAVPLLKDSRFGRSLIVDGAGRRTHYDGVGWVTTWKAGLVYDATDWLRLRATRSLDIRAANLGERFAPQTETTNRPVVYNGVTSIPLIVSGGNPSLRPERSHNYTLGMVFKGTHNLFPGLRFSVDYYNIDIKGVIATPPLETSVVSSCVAGVKALCDLITFGPNNTVAQINIFTSNLSSLKTSGLDIEALYTTSLRGIGADGTLTFESNATYVPHFELAQFGSTIDFAGQTGQPISNQGGFGVPHWIASASVSYDRGPFGLTLKGRYIESGINNATAVGPDGDCQQTVLGQKSCTPQTLNKVPGRVYFTLATHFDFMIHDSRKVELFAVIDNLLNKAPPFDPGQYYTNPIYFDQIGRRFRVGARFKY